MNQPNQQSEKQSGEQGRSKEQPIEHQRLLEWWHALADNRGDRAALRRASSVQQVMFNPGFHRLWHRLRNTRWNRSERVALIAALAARIKQNDARKPFAAQLGSPPAGREKAVLSGLRFRRLLQTSLSDDLLQACSRAIAIRNGQANIVNLAESVYWWNDRVHRQWAFDYYAANPSAD